MGMSAFILTGCDKGGEPGPTKGKNPPIELDCDFFKGVDRVLVDDPDADVDYVIKCNMPVRDADIKVMPGVVIEFEQDAGINVYSTTGKASFSAIGTSEKPVIMRGVKKEKGYWRGIMYDCNSPENKLTYAKIEDAGGKAFNSNGDMGSIVLWANSKLSIDNSEISNSQTYGLNAVYKGSVLSINNTKFKGNNSPVIIEPGYVDNINNTNDYLGNDNDFVYVNSGTFGVTTWRKVNVPYTVLNSAGGGGGITAKKLLTIEPGVKILFEASTRLKIDEGGGGIKAIGTVSDPIVFTGVNKVPGGWDGIYFHSEHPLNEIAFAEFHYSGGSTGHGSIRLWYGKVLNLHDVSFSKITNCAIKYREWSVSYLTTNNITLDEGACLMSVY